MKKFVKFTLALLLMFGAVAVQANTVQAANKRQPYNDSQGYLINGYWDTRASFNLKLRHNYWFYSKWQHEVKFRIGGGGAVKMDEEYGNYDPNKFQQMTGAWAMDDNYVVSVRDRSGRERVGTTLREGKDVAVEMKRLKKAFNNANVQVGWTIKISSYWNDTITPNIGSSKNLYIAKPLGRNSYSFTFTDEGLVEEAKNLRGLDSNESLILLPVRDYGRMYKVKIQVRTDQSGKVRFTSYPQSSQNVLGTEYFVVSIKGDTGSERIKRFYYGDNANKAFRGTANILNESNLRYGDYIKFKFANNADSKARLGRNLRDESVGYFNLTNDAGRIKLTRYGFLSDNGYLIKYTDRV